MIGMYCIFGLYSLTAAGERLMSILNTPKNENTKQKSKLCSDQETEI